jgi:hormone-sensitive lipase
MNDVINGYLSILSTFSSKIKRVIMFGDSAGGNLIMGTSNYLILHGLRPPDKIILLYPALVCNANFFCPSLLKSYNDEILNFFHLQYVLMLYLGKENMGEFYNMFISPLFTPKIIMEKYPQVSIICGDQDPLWDHSFYLGHLLKRANKKVQLLRIPQFSHGFMYFYLRNKSWLKELALILDHIKEMIIKED